MNESKIFEPSIAQQFQTEKYNRIFDQINDPDILRKAAKLMLDAYQKQRAATQWIMKQHLDAVWQGKVDIMKNYSEIQ
jgi:hypothetical protein